MTAWQGSNRGDRLPPNWARLRQTILARDGHRCTWTDELGRCTQPATDVDHVSPGDNHHPTNLRSLCRWHHLRKSSLEGNTARHRQTNRRPPEPHPGLLT